MEKKSTEYCFKGCKDFAKYLKEQFKNKVIDGDTEFYYFQENINTNDCGYDYSQNIKGIEITWQEYKQLFIDKDMKTTQQEIDELKVKLQELENKVKEENEFKVGDWIYAKYSKPDDFRNAEYVPVFKLEEIFSEWLRPEKDYGTGVKIKYCRKATQAEITEYLEKNKKIEISGYKAVFNKSNKTVSFGCKKDITKTDLEAILAVMELNEKFTYKFSISEDKLFQNNIDGQDFEDSISKETIQKLIKALD